MVLATSNKSKQLLCVSYIDRVRLGDLKLGFEDLRELLAELRPGFRLLADLSQLEFMETACATELGQFMDLMDQHGVSQVVRVIPDPKKDIGMNILTILHYRRRPRVVTCATMTEAAQELSL
jgi:hypothetical protein